MANEIRLRRNNIAGTITDNPLTNVATTINSPGFVDLPTVDATNHLILILDPLETNGPAEIVRVTAHTVAATSVTVTRGAEGSAARTHIMGTTWFHGPVTTDTTEVLTSGTRPSVPYTGEQIYETDTGKYQSYNGTAWVQRDAGGTLGFATTSTTESAIVDADLTGVTTTVTVGTGRRIKVTWYDSNLTGTVANDTFDLKILEDGTQVAAGKYLVNAGNAEPTMITILAVRTPSAGSHTYKAHATRVAGTGNVNFNRSATSPGFILVEDIGAV